VIHALIIAQFARRGKIELEGVVPTDALFLMPIEKLASCLFIYMVVTNFMRSQYMLDGVKVSNTSCTSDSYEYIDESGIYEVTVNYIGKNSLIDHIKAALKRDFELLYADIKNGKSGENLD